MRMAKKFLIFIVLALCCVGIVGGFGWTCYIAANGGQPITGDTSAWVPAIGLAVAAFVITPVLKTLADKLNE